MNGEEEKRTRQGDPRATPERLHPRPKSMAQQVRRCRRAPPAICRSPDAIAGNHAVPIPRRRPMPRRCPRRTTKTTRREKTGGEEKTRPPAPPPHAPYFPSPPILHLPPPPVSHENHHPRPRPERSHAGGTVDMGILICMDPARRPAMTTASGPGRLNDYGYPTVTCTQGKQLLGEAISDNDGRPRPAGMRTTRGDGRELAAQSINATRTMRGEDREKGKGR